ncbi:syntaxin-binding protein 5-like isoform X2 [Dysidea avara]|uniref:syntaxin-binding protein 5-like isoform X2 n=1 Tax=Dysidea avara TaxID=196820 RepID=UPI0033179363
MTSIKKLVGRSPDRGSKIRDTLEARQFVASEVFSHGFPYHPTSLSYDVLQSLVAVGNDMGTIRIFGKAGLEVCLQHDPRVPIKQLIFITNKGYLISVTNDDTLNLWVLQQKPARLMQQLKFKQDKVTKCSYTYGSHWLYVGTDKSNVLLVRVEGLVLSAYNIPWNEVAVSQGGQRNRPGAVVDMLEHPLDQGKVLLGYTSGLMVLWNLATKQVERRYSHTEKLTSLSWRGSGKEFAASFDCGSIGVWNVKSNGTPNRLFYPFDTSRGQRGPMTGQFNPVGKLELMNVKGNPLFVFSGGNPKEYLSTNIALMQGKSLSILLCDSPIVDFITVPSYPHLSAVQDPKLLVVLCQDGLNVFDIGEFGSPLFDVPFVLDLHKPAVTSLEYLDECPDNVTSSLYSVQSKQPLKKKPWPFTGGSKSHDKLPANLLITGHCDGCVKLWQANSISIQLAMTISTMESFTRTPTAQSSSPTSPSNISASLAAIATDISPPPPTKSTSPVSQTMPPQSTDTGMSPANTERRKTWSGNGKNSELTMSTVDDYIIVDLPSPATKDDTSSRVPSSEFFPVSQVILNPDDLSMCVVNIGLCVMLYSFQPAQTGAAIKSLTVKLESSSAVPLSPPRSPVTSCTTDCGWNVLPETPSTGEGAGFYLMFCCRCVPIDKDQPHPVITCVEYSSKYGILVIGLTSGLVIVDTVNCKCLLVEVDEIELMGFAQAKRKGWMSQISPAKEPATIEKISKKVRRKSEKLPPPMAGPTITATTGTDFTEIQNTLREGNSQLYVTTVRIADLNTDKQALLPNGSIWVGTNNGNVIAMDLHVKSATTKGQPRTVELCPNGIYHRLHYPTVSLSFLDDTGNIIDVPSQRHAKSTLSSVTASMAASTSGGTQYAVLCSEVLCKVYTLPDGGKLTMLELVDKLKTSIVKTETCHIEGCPSLICITFNAEILVYSLPALRPVAMIPFTPLNDLRVLRTFHVATNGSSAIYMYSPSEVQRLSVLKHNESTFTDVLPELHTKGVVNSELPTSTGVLNSLFQAGQYSTLDRDKLFGDGAGRPPRNVAETRPGLSSQPTGGTVGSANFMSHARELVLCSLVVEGSHNRAFVEPSRAVKIHYQPSGSYY